jgi:hypothetical protein
MIKNGKNGKHVATIENAVKPITGITTEVKVPQLGNVMTNAACNMGSE